MNVSIKLLHVRLDIKKEGENDFSPLSINYDIAHTYSVALFFNIIFLAFVPFPNSVKNNYSLCLFLIIVITLFLVLSEIIVI